MTSTTTTEWTEVHDEVQQQLALLEADVRRSLPGIDVESGQTHGKAFFLCSYRIFSIPNRGLDRIVAGVTFTPDNDGVRVEADVSGERSGDWISGVPAQTVANSKSRLLAAAQEVGRKLCQSAEAITRALKDSARNAN